MLDLGDRDVAGTVIVEHERGEFPGHADDPPTEREDHGGRLGLRVDVLDPIVAEQPEPLLVLPGDRRGGCLVGVVGGLVGRLDVVLELSDLIGRVALGDSDGVRVVNTLGVDQQAPAKGEGHQEHRHADQLAPCDSVESSPVTELGDPMRAVLHQQAITGEEPDHWPGDESEDDRDERDRQAHQDETPPVEPVHERVDRHGEGTAGESEHCASRHSLVKASRGALPLRQQHISISLLFCQY